MWLLRTVTSQVPSLCLDRLVTVWAKKMSAPADVVHELLGQSAEVDVGSSVYQVQRDRVVVGAGGGHERQTVGELTRVGDELHALEQGLTRQLVVAAAQVVHAVGAVGVADVRDGVDELAGARRIPLSTACAQNWRDTWNCSLMVTALSMLTSPFASRGVWS